MIVTIRQRRLAAEALSFIDSKFRKGARILAEILAPFYSNLIFRVNQINQKEFNMSMVLQFVCCIAISFLVWFIFGMILLSPQFGIVGTDIFGPANVPISTIIIAAVVIGVVQGALTAIFIFWQKTNTILGCCFSSFAATEIFLFGAMLIHSVLFIKDNSIKLNSTNLLQGTIFFIFWYFVLTIIFLTPSVVIGITTRKVLNITDSTQLS